MNKHETAILLRSIESAAFNAHYNHRCALACVAADNRVGHDIEHDYWKQNIQKQYALVGFANQIAVPFHKVQAAVEHGKQRADEKPPEDVDYVELATTGRWEAIAVETR